MVARWGALCEGLTAAEQGIVRMERATPAQSSAGGSIGERLAALTGGIVAAVRRLASLEMGHEAQHNQHARTQRLRQAAAPAAGTPSSVEPAHGSHATIPSTACAGAAVSDEDRQQEAKVGAAAVARGFSAATAAFRYVPADYYDRTLQERSVLLGAPSVEYLCKTIIVENRKWELAQALPPPPPGGAVTLAGRSRYFGVVFQYGARFKKENMEREVRKLGGLSKKQCQIFFADEAEVVAMTGFVHNVSAIVDALCSSSQLSRIHIS